MKRQENIITLQGLPLYFVMIAKIAEHSFIIIGATDSATKRNRILLAVGKKVDRDTTVWGFFGDGVDSSLKMEGDIFEDFETGEFTQESLEITYKAYGITQDDYVQFLRSLCRLQNSRISAFVPRERNQQGFPFIYTELAKTRIGDLPSFALHLDYATISKNSCRTSAIEMLLVILKRSEKDPDISNSFYKNLPYKNTIYQGQLLHLIYVLPLPPADIYKQNRPFGAAIHLIYNRLSSIPLSKPDQELTLRKFLAVKDLYEQLANAPLDFEPWLTILDDWMGQNARLINTHRGQAFKEATATMQTISAVFKLLTVGNVSNRLGKAI